MPNWLSTLIQAIFANVLWEFLLALGVGGLIAGLKAKREKWAGPAMYGLAAFALIFVIGFTITGQAPLHGTSQEVTPENVEDNLKLWADHLGMSFQRKAVPDGDFFLYTAMIGNGPVDIFRAKEKPGYLQLKATLNFSPEHQAALAKLSEHDFTQFLNQLGLEVARLRGMSTDVGILFDQKTHQPHQATVVFVRGVPIPNLNEGYFSSQCDEIGGAVNQIRAFVNMGLATDVKKDALNGQ